MKRLALAPVSLLALTLAAHAAEPPGIFSGKNVDWGSIGSNTIPGAALGANAAAINGALPHVANLVALQAYPPAASGRVHRDGYAAAGDGGGADYTYSASPCSLGAGAGDGGYQAQGGSGCWIADAPAGGLDAAVWGAKYDGATDAKAVLTTALADAPGCVVVAPSANGLYLGSKVTVNSCLKGTSFQPANKYPSNAFPGTSWIKCGKFADACVAAGTSGSLSMAPIVEGLNISGGSGAPTSGSIGFQAAGGFNAQTRDLNIVNFDTCYKYGPGTSTAPISVINRDVSMSQCQSHYFVNDGSPEIKFFGGRWGTNGGGDYTATQDFVYQTLTTAVGAGGGPNGTLIDGVQINPGVGGVACAFRWGGYTGSGGVQAETRLTNDHVEWHSYTGALTQGLFCSDPTTPAVFQLFVSDMVTATGGLTVPMFSLDPATAPEHWFFSDNNFGCSSVTLTLPAVSSVAYSNLHFNHNFMCGNGTLTGNTNQAVFLDGNQWGTLTIGGAWFQLTGFGEQYSALTDTATGNVSWASPNLQSWSPVLKFGGATTGIAQTAGGSWHRTAGGGFEAFFTITLSSVGTATGAATITGLPRNCVNGPSAAPAQTASGMSGITSPTLALAGSTIYPEMVSGGTGLASLTNTNFTNTTVFAGTVTCELAQ